MVSRLPLLLAALVALSLLAVVPASASASLAVQHESTAIAEEGGEGLVAPGDIVTISETIEGTDLMGDATGLQATLRADDAAKATVLTGTAAYPDLSFGEQSAGSRPLRVRIGSSAACGETVRLTLTVTGDGGLVDIPIAVPTGAPGETLALQSTHVPQPIPSKGPVESNAVVDADGRLKGVRVKIGRLQHTYIGDLRLSLIAPDGTEALLFDQAGAAADDLENVTFAASGGQDVGSVAAPYTGRTLNAPALAGLDGRMAKGTWKLKVDDRNQGEFGQLESWGLELATATCSPLPVANFSATPNPVDPGATVTFDGSSSLDPNDPITAHEWDLDGDGAYDDATGAVATTSYPTARAVSVGLRVTGGGETDEQRIALAVTGAPVAALDASPTLQPDTGQEITLSAAGTTDDGDIVGYEWDLDGDGAFERTTDVATTTASWNRGGPRTVRVRVTDDIGAQATASLDIGVKNRVPSAAIGVNPSPPLAGAATTLSATNAVDPDGTVTGYDWDFDGDGIYDEIDVPEASVTHVFETTGTYEVRLRVRDDFGGTAAVTRSVRVTRAPTAAIQASPQTVALNQDVAFTTVGASDPDGAPLAKFEWDLDGAGDFERDTGTTGTTTFKYTTAAARTVRVRVTDADGATAIASVVVTASNALPTAALSASTQQPLVGQQVTLDASGSSDSDGTVKKHEWDLDGDTEFEYETGVIPTATVSFPNPGSVLVRVRVVDNDGGTAVASKVISVKAPPTTEPEPDPDPNPNPNPGPGGSGGTGDGNQPGGTPAPGDVKPAGDPGTPQGGGPAGPAAFTASLTGAPIQRAKRVRRRGLAVTCQAAAAARCVLRAQLSARDAKRLGIGKRRKVARIAFVERSVAAGTPARLVLRLTARGKRALQRARTVRVLVRGYADDGQGHRIALSRVVLVRR